MPLRPPIHRAPHQKGEHHRLDIFRRHAAAKQRREQRGTRGQRGYDGAWYEIRAAILAEEPYCRSCADQGIVRLARIVDHIQSIRTHPHLRFEPDNLQPLCFPCHNAKTNRYDGGFGLPRRP